MFYRTSAVEYLLDLMKDSDQVMLLLAQAKQIAQQYYRITGKPLGITGEVAEYEAAHTRSHPHASTSGWV
jgi:hypothetical protein